MFQAELGGSQASGLVVDCRSWAEVATDRGQAARTATNTDRAAVRQSPRLCSSNPQTTEKEVSKRKRLDPMPPRVAALSPNRTGRGSDGPHARAQAGSLLPRVRPRSLPTLAAWGDAARPSPRTSPSYRVLNAAGRWRSRRTNRNRTASRDRNRPRGRARRKRRSGGRHPLPGGEHNRTMSLHRPDRRYCSLSGLVRAAGDVPTHRRNAWRAASLLKENLHPVGWKSSQ